MRRRRALIAVLAVVAVLLLAVVAVLIWALTPLGPADDALVALHSGDGVTVAERPEGIVFAPSDDEPHVGLVLYPGARVDARSYAPLARRIAERGYLVVIQRMPFNLAVLAPEKAGDAIAAHPEIRLWAVGGHSLGGAMAARYAASHADRVSGLALMAAYPPEGDALAGVPVEATSVYGTFDEIVDAERLVASKSQLPTSTAFVPIEGGNHSQFGSYGRQWGDNAANIPAKMQQALAAEAILYMLRPLRIRAQ